MNADREHYRSVTHMRVSFDVTEVVGLGAPCTIAGLLFLPSQETGSIPTRVIVLLPGGSYTKNYYHLEVPGRTDYSAAEFFARHGLIALAIDHLGTGESSWPRDGRRVTLEIMAAANARVVTLLKERLASGSLSALLPAVRNPFLIGHGHSLGGYLTQIQQAGFNSYDAVVVAGSPCQPMKEFAGRPPPVMIRAHNDGYFLLPRAQNHAVFYFSDVPADVIASDDATFSALPEGMLELGIPGRTVSDAGKIVVPVFLAFGENDLSPNPHGEPIFYCASRDVSLYVLPRSGHCHNTASTRHLLWNRVLNWISAIGGEPQQIDILSILRD